MSASGCGRTFVTAVSALRSRKAISLTGKPSERYNTTIRSSCFGMNGTPFPPQPPATTIASMPADCRPAVFAAFREIQLPRIETTPGLSAPHLRSRT